MEKEKIIDRIKKLLALSGNNPNEAEAEAALLKAQALMAEHDVSVDLSESDKIEYGEERCEHKWDMGYRKPLAHVIADNFRCELYWKGTSVVFFGHKIDARIAKEAFEFAYKFAMKQSNREYYKAKDAGKETKGVCNSYCLGFIHGLKQKLDEQCVALMIVKPADVTKTFNEMTEGWKTSRKSGMKMDSLDMAAYKQGIEDGKTILNGRRLEAK